MSIISVRYNGVNLIKAGHSLINEGGTALTAELWYLYGPSMPAAGTHTVEVRFVGDVDYRCAGAISLENVLQVPHEDVAKTTSGTGTISATVSASEGAWVVDSVACANVGGFSLNAAGGSERYDISSAGNAGAGSTTAAETAGDYTAEWTHDNPGNMAQVAASFAPLP
jgi:hypothetical protein